MRLGCDTTGYQQSMRFKLGYITGFASGYYLGAKAGRQRYDQLNRSLRKLRHSEVVEKAAGKARDTVSHVLPHRSNGSADATTDAVAVADADGSRHGANTVPAAAGGPSPTPTLSPTPSPSPSSTPTPSSVPPPPGGTSPYSSSR